MTDADAFFPELSDKEWVRADAEEHPADTRNRFAYAFATYLRRQ